MRFVRPETVLKKVYGKTSVELGMSEKRRDEVIVAAIFSSFRNQEFGTKLHLPKDYSSHHPEEDSRGIDMVIASESGRRKSLQIKGVHIQRSINRRRQHRTQGAARFLGRKTRKWMDRDSEELTKVIRAELKKILHDYSGVFLIIQVNADFATQTSLKIAIKKCQKLLSNIKAQEVWLLRHIPVHMIEGKKATTNCVTYEIIKVVPDEQTYVYSFAL